MEVVSTRRDSRLTPLAVHPTGFMAVSRSVASHQAYRVVMQLMRPIDHISHVTSLDSVTQTGAEALSRRIYNAPKFLPEAAMCCFASG